MQLYTLNQRRKFQVQCGNYEVTASDRNENTKKIVVVLGVVVHV